MPDAELPTIRTVNADTLRSGRPVTVRQFGRSQVLVVHGCPLPGPLAGVTGWTMTRVFTGEGRAYNQLLAGLTLLALTVFGSALWLGTILVSWSRKLKRLEEALADHDAGKADLPTLPPTGEPQLDRLVDALNAVELVSPTRAGVRRRPSGWLQSADGPPASPMKFAIPSRPCASRPRTPSLPPTRGVAYPR